MASLKNCCCASESMGTRASSVSAVPVSPMLSDDAPSSVLVRSPIGEWRAMGLSSRGDDFTSGFVDLVLRMFVLL